MEDLYLNMHYLALPDEMMDRDNIKNPAGSATVKSRLVMIFAGDDYSGAIHMMRRANPSWANALIKYCQDVVTLGPVGNELLEESGVSQYEQKRMDTHELMLDLLMRSRNVHIQPFYIAGLDVMALRDGVSTGFYRQLKHVHLLHEKTWSEDLCRQVSEVLRLRFEERTGSRVRWAAFDNKALWYNVYRQRMSPHQRYPIHMTHQHVNRDGGRKDTVNWLSIRVDEARYPMDQISRGNWHNGSSRFVSLPLFDPRRADFAAMRHMAWVGFMGQAAAGQDILAHPAVAVQPRKTDTFYQRPVLNVNTASYDDIYTSTEQIKNTILAGAEMILLVGDQQTFIRLFWLKILRPASYDWLLPLPGEWHFLVHALMALHKLWFRPLIELIVSRLGWEKTITDVWTSVEKYIYFDRFYQLIIWGFVDYFSSVVPEAYRNQPERLLEAVAANPSAVYAATFLYEFGLPWLRLRHGIRANEHAIIDLAWPYTFHWFRATNKYNYALMAVYVTFYSTGMKPQLSALWSEERTASLAGNSGRNVPYDFTVERMNREASQFVGDNPTDEQLLKLPEMLNATRHICPRFEAALGMSELDADEGSQYSHQLDADKQTVREIIRGILGDDWDALRAASNRQKFQHRPGRRLENPSARVARAAGASASDAVGGGGGGGEDEDEGEDEMDADPDPDGRGEDDDDDDDDAMDDDDDDAEGAPDEAWANYVLEALKRCRKR